MFYYYRFFVERIVFITLFVAITCEARAQFYISLLHDTLPNPSQIRAAKIKSRWLWMYKYENGENYGLAKCLKKQYFDRNGYLVEEWVYDTTEATVDYKTFFEYNFDGRLQKSRDEKNGVLIATTRYYYQGTTPRISKIQRTFQDGTIDYTLQYSYDSKGRVVAATLDYGAGFEHQNKNFKVRYSRSPTSKKVMVFNSGLKNQRKIRIVEKQLQLRQGSTLNSWVQKKGLCKLAHRVTSTSSSSREISGYTTYFYSKKYKATVSKTSIVWDSYFNPLEEIDYNAQQKPISVLVYGLDFFN